MSSSTTLSNNHAQGSIVPDRRHSIARAAFRADLMEEIDPSIFDYQTKRETGLIPQNEEPRWGYEDSRKRHETRIRYNSRYVAQSFFKVDWDKGSTGRGVDVRRGEYRLEGPKGECLAHVADVEAPTLPETRRLWRMVDQGDDEGVDPQYDGPPIDWDEDTSWSDDEDVAPIGQTKVDDEIGPVTDSQQHAQVGVSGEELENLQDIAAQAFLMLRDNDLGPFNGTRQEAEFESPGEMRNVLSQIVDESSQSPNEYQATIDLRTSLESSRESTKHLGKKREWASLGKDGDGASGERSDDGRSNPKGLKRWRGFHLAGLNEDDSSDGESQPQPKRQRVRFEQPIEAPRTVGQGSDTSDNSKADNSSNGVGSSETDASSIDSGLRQAQPDQALGPVKIRARPTFYGISTQKNEVTKRTEWVSDNNEADDLVVTHVRKPRPQAYEDSPGMPPRIEPNSQPWTEEEEEDLRSWLQDYGMQKKWSEIAWCLHRAEDDCQTRYREIVVARNKRAGRDPEAGLSGWVDPELEVTPEEIAQLVAEDLARLEAAR